MRNPRKASQDSFKERLDSPEAELRTTRAEPAGLHGDLRELIVRYDAEKRGLRWVGAAPLDVAALGGCWRAWAELGQMVKP